MLNNNKEIKKKSSVIKFTNFKVVKNKELVLGDVWVKDGKIINPEERFWDAQCAEEYEPTRIIQGNECILSPGFIDIQINGAFGIDFSSVHLTEEEVQTVAKGLLQYGVTSFCPTIVSSRVECYSTICPKFKVNQEINKDQSATMTQEIKKDQGATILGLHFEGPFINQDRNGAHEKDILVSPTTGIQGMLERYSTLQDVAIITMAPELEGALETIKELKKRGIVIAAGHSDATIDVAHKAMDAGVTLLTHLFNAMSPFHHRDPGLIGLLGATHNRPFYSMILDGIHCHEASVRMAFACHPDGLVLVTDAMSGLGLQSGTYCLAGKEVDVSSDKAVLHESQTLAGSIISVDASIRNLYFYTDCTIVQALETATLHPAQVLGISQTKGTMEFGADADFAILDQDLHVVETYIQGELVWKKDHN